MSKYDLSIIVPSIRVQNLEQLYFSFEKSVEPYTFEMIVVGPYQIPENLYNKENVKYIKDFGSPSRCVQLGTSLVEGKYLCWFSDDGLANHTALAQCVDLYENGKASNKDAICLRYIEGEHNNSNHFPDTYWRARSHGDQQLIGIGENYLCAPLGMYNTEYFRELGGLDCRYEHINFCTHDLAFRLQNAGGKVHLSPAYVAKFIWSWHGNDARPIQDAYNFNDKDLYHNEWSKDQSNRLKINYWNWCEQPSKWERRFGK